MTIEEAAPAWVPRACTLVTADQPLRVAEFDALFAVALTEIRRLERTRLRLTLRGGPDVEAAVGELTERESQCCGFFAFAITRGEADLLDLDVIVPSSQIEVLDALAARAANPQATP